MSLALRLRQWWSRVTGRSAPVAPQERPAARARPRIEASSNPSPAPDGLSLAPENGVPDKVSLAERKHLGAGGFDPYSSDAGYEKPHGWDSVDRK